MGSFGAISFREKGQGEGKGFAVWGKTGAIAIKKIPGGDNNVIQKVHVGLPRLALSVRVTAAQLTSLYGVVGTSDTLTFAFETATATLESIENVEEWFHGLDAYTATLNLIRTASVGTTSSPWLTEAGGAAWLTEGGDEWLLE